MSNDPKVSIIIPVYGVEKYIVKCIESIKSQSFEDFEVILINDGTKDSSIEIAKKIIGDDQRFIILNKENGGQGSARNLGLDQAQGDYIAFIDSDDYVEPDFLKAMYEQIVREKVDICTCNVNLISPMGVVEKIFKSDPVKYVASNDYLNANFYISNWMWDKLFRKEVFDGMRFDPSVRTFEDAHFIFRLVHNKTITSADRYLYNYVQHQGSTSNDVKPSYLQDRIAVFDTQKRFYQEVDGFSNKYLEYVYLKTFVFFYIATIARHSKNYSLDVKRIQEVLDPNIFNIKNIFNLVLKDKKIGLSLAIFMISPFLFWLLARFWFRNKAA